MVLLADKIVVLRREPEVGEAATTIARGRLAKALSRTGWRKMMPEDVVRDGWRGVVARWIVRRRAWV